MPPTEEMIAEATTTLGQVQVVSFTATPDRLDPSNSTTTITWKVIRPQRPGLTLRLNGMNIPNEGSRTFTQFDTQTYRLSAHFLIVNETLRQLTVVYDTSQCIRRSWSEEEVRTLLGQQLTAFIASDKKLSLRSDPQIEVNEQGIGVSIRLKREIDNFPDLKVNLDLVLMISVQDGQPVVRYRSFKIDTDWPWWVTTLSVGITKIVEEVIDEKIEGRLKPQLLARIKEQIQQVVSLFPDFRLHSIVTRTDEVEIQVCPTS